MANASPRIENGIIKWYCGDAFFINFDIIDDETKAPLELGEYDSIEVSFYNAQLRPVKTFEFRGAMVCNELKYHINETITKLFPVGKYTYCIKYHKNNNETIATVKAVGECEVERCH